MGIQVDDMAVGAASTAVEAAASEIALPDGFERVSSLGDERLAPFVSLTDTQLRNRLEPEKGLFIAESGKVISRALDAGFEPISFLMGPKWAEPMRVEVERARMANPNSKIPAFVASREQLESLTGYDVARGALAAFRRPSLPEPGEPLSDARRIAVLEDITNAANVGAIFRSAAALGIDALLLTPGCCDALYRRAVRVSMGTVFQVPWTYIGSSVSGKGAHGNVFRKGGWAEVGIPELRRLGFKVASLALADDAIAMDDPALKQADKLALVLGTEGDGLSPATIAASDFVVTIPMSHGVDSLNVSAASAVAFWELRA